MESNFHLQEVSLPGCTKFGFLKAGKGPKLTKNKKLECFMKGNTTSFLRKLGQATMLKTYILVLYTCVCNLCNHQFWLEATKETSFPSFGENLMLNKIKS